MTGGGRLVSAGRAHFSWDDLDRLLAAAIGETPAVLRRRLLLERPAWQLAHGYTTADVEAGAGYGPTAAFSRAFARAHGSPPSLAQWPVRHHRPPPAPVPAGGRRRPGAHAARLTLTGPRRRSERGPALDLAHPRTPWRRRSPDLWAVGDVARVSTQRAHGRGDRGAAAGGGRLSGRGSGWRAPKGLSGDVQGLDVERRGGVCNQSVEQPAGLARGG